MKTKLWLAGLAWLCMSWMPSLARDWTIEVQNQGAQGGYIETAEGSTPYGYSGQWPGKGYFPTFYIHFPQGSFSVKSQNEGTVDVRICDPQEDLLTNVSAKNFSFTVKEEGWVRFALHGGVEGRPLRNFTISSDDATSDRVFLAGWRSAPSLHLNGFESSDPDCPKGNSFDWIYDEVQVPTDADFLGTYVESFGFAGGYIGIQNNGPQRHDIIFSVWDDGDTDAEPELAGFKRSGIITHASDPHVVAERFGGEGTGNHVIIQGDQWKPGQWVRFLINVRPEQITLYPKGADGTPHPVVYNNSIITAWYKAEGIDKDWHFIACLRQAGTNHFFGSGFNSFLEEYTRGGTSQGQAFHKGYYRRIFTRDMLTGNWFNRNRFWFGHTDGGNGKGARNDRYQTSVDDYQGEPAMYMRSGGYTHPFVGGTEIPLRSPVGIVPSPQELDSLFRAEIQPAIQQQDEERMEMLLLDGTMIHEDMKGWRIESCSSEETSGEGSNGRAALAIDGLESTYWHTQWQGASPGYPHTLILRANDNLAHALSYIQINEGRPRYRAGKISVAVSNASNRFQTVIDHQTVPDAANIQLQLPEGTQAKRIKITFEEPAPGHQKFLVVNEIRLSAFSEKNLHDIAENFVATADQFNGYSSNDVAPLKSLLDDPSTTSEQLQTALRSLAQQGKRIKYGDIERVEQFSSERAYHLFCPSGYGTLMAHADTELPGVIGVAADKVSTALPAALEKDNVLSPYNNWMILPVPTSRVANTFYLYNMGLKRFLSLNGPALLVDEPTPITIVREPNGFRLRNQARVIALNPSNEKLGVRGRPAEGSYFLIYDNYNLVPSLAAVTEVRERTHNEVTGIAPLPLTDSRANLIYDLQGRQVDQPTQGLYIINGKKIYLP